MTTMAFEDGAFRELLRLQPLELKIETGYAHPWSIEASLAPKNFIAPLPLVGNVAKSD